jgi:hypothetical protein
LRDTTLFENFHEIELLSKYAKEFTNMNTLQDKIRKFQEHYERQKSEEGRRVRGRELKHSQSNFSSHDGAAISRQSSERSSYLEKNNLFREFAVNELLDQIPNEEKIELNLIYILSLIPAGMSLTDIRDMVGIYKTWFGENIQFVRRLEER